MQLHHRASTAAKSLAYFSFALKLVLLYAAEGQSQHQHRGPDLHWYSGTATWYGDPEGDGSIGNLPSQDLFFPHFTR